MASKKTGFRADRYLNEEEKADLRNLSFQSNREKALAKLDRLKYSKSKTARFGRFLTKAASKPSTYPRGAGGGTGRRGRPAGSYNPKYAAVGGVYEFRKRQAFLRRQQLQKLSISPEQQAVLRQIESRRRANDLAPENRTIPDTRGNFNFDSIMKEIEDASNIVK